MNFFGHFQPIGVVETLLVLSAINAPNETKRVKEQGSHAPSTFTERHDAQGESAMRPSPRRDVHETAGGDSIYVCNTGAECAQRHCKNLGLIIGAPRATEFFDASTLTKNKIVGLYEKKSRA